MKCEVCGRSITINWGSDRAIVCQDHTDHIAELGELKRKAAKEWTEGTVQHIPAEIEASDSVLLRLWWAFTWRFMLMFVVIGGCLWTLLVHSMAILIENNVLTVGVADIMVVLFYLLMAAVFIFVTLDRIVGKKLGNVRLVVVSAGNS